MPIHHALWRVGQHPERLTGSQLGEKQLEDMIVEQPEILSSDWMPIARQVKTSFGDGSDLTTAFQERFHAELEEHEWNQSHQIVIVADSVTVG